MKKTIALILSVVMLFSLTVTAFADTIDQDNPAQKTAEIITKSTKDDGTSAESWSVSYPATTQLAWNTLVTGADAKISYTAKAHLAYNKKLTVTVAPNAESKMTFKDTAAGVSASLAYTLKELSGSSYVALAPAVVGPVADVTKDFYIDIPQAQWDAAPVGAYSTLITFTAVAA